MRRDAVDLDGPGGRCVEPGDQPEQGGLAGAVRAQYREPLSRVQVELVDREHLATPAAVAEIAELQDCAHEAARCCTDVSRALMTNASASRIPA